jgi:hypothetical protein
LIKTNSYAIKILFRRFIVLLFFLPVLSSFAYFVLYGKSASQRLNPNADVPVVEQFNKLFVLGDSLFTSILEEQYGEKKESDSKTLQKISPEEMNEKLKSVGVESDSFSNHFVVFLKATLYPLILAVAGLILFVLWKK